MNASAEDKTKGVARSHPSESAVQLRLNGLHVFRLESFRTLHHLELHRLAFLKAAESTRLDGREMHENIFAVLTADEAVALGVVKPLYCSLFQFLFLFLW